VSANSVPELERDRRVSAAAPIVAYGDRSVLRVPGHLKALGAQRVLLVCGRRSFDASGAAAMLPDLESSAKVHRWSDFAANTDSADLRNGLGIMREFEPDVVIGVGGGSALDMAKLLCGFRDVPHDRVLDSIRSGVNTATRQERLVLVPTTSGSGAEATHFAVVYIGHEKYSVGGDAMRPDVIALDPTLAVSGSPYQRATSGIDAVCQAIESLWAVSATDRSRHFARTALRALMPAIESFVNEPDPESARAMCIGSHFAGRAIDISRTTAAHALSYGITKNYGLSHGHAVALTLGQFLELHADAVTGSLHPDVDPTRHQMVMSEILQFLKAANGSEGRIAFNQLMQTIGLSSSISNIASSATDREHFVRTVNVERLGNNPYLLDEATLHLILALSNVP